jgi:DNA primase
MAGLIPQGFIDDLLSRIDIVDVIDSRVQLKKTGRNYSALCPFHKEKSPSFSVNQDKQFYYCFGCGAGGNAVGFLMDYERLEFIEAVEELARVANIEVPREAIMSKENAQHPHLYTLLESAAQFYRKSLSQHANAVDYLKKRGLTGEIAKQFGIGYAPNGWDNLLKAFGKNESDITNLEKSGMLVEKEGTKNYYDRFRDRIMFPIRDSRGRVIAFGGRVLGDEKPKYLNSPETPIFHKGKELYGFYEAKQANRHLARVLIVEGYMDVVALAQHGINYAVATLGTATSSAHIEKLFRSVNKIVFCFDGDDAGRTAAWRAMESTLPVIKDGFEAAFLFLPEGEDPDTLVRKEGADLFTKRIIEAPSLSEFFFAHLMQDINMQTLDGRARLSQSALPLVRKIPTGALQQLMLNKLGELTGLNSNQLSSLNTSTTNQSTSQMNMPSTKPSSNEPPLRRMAIRQPTSNAPKVTLTPTKTAIILLLHHPELATNIDASAISLSGGGLEEALLLELVNYIQANPNSNTASLLGHWHDSPLGQALTALAAYEYLLAPESAQTQLSDSLARITSKQTTQDLKTLLEELKHSPTPEKKARLQELLAQKHGAGSNNP